MKNCRIPSSFLPSCNSTNFVSDIYVVIALFFAGDPLHLLPGVTNADIVHSLNLSIALKYL